MIEKILTGKTALVTGATRGIGKAIALELANQGATVYATATSEAGATEITNYLQQNSYHGQGLVLNVAETVSIKNVTDFLQEQKIIVDILVNNAGITRDNLLLRMKDEEWEQVIQTNLTGVFKLCKNFSRPMLKQHWGRIINISSITAIVGNPGQTNYAAAKAGVMGFSKSLALELASRQITVNVVAPGFIATDMTHSLTEAQREHACKMIPIGSMGTPEDIATLVAFLASPAAKYITGETITVAGGLAIH
ncbi:MAG: 3-oxoacyl-ACP reductase FabG [Gammaproteobacteria bacterium]|nr:3-oxoacyl-ACP reductase FabG [Gammaproteobacteria bacterium]